MKSFKWIPMLLVAIAGIWLSYLVGDWLGNMTVSRWPAVAMVTVGTGISAGAMWFGLDKVEQGTQGNEGPKGYHFDFDKSLGGYVLSLVIFALLVVFSVSEIVATDNLRTDDFEYARPMRGGMYLGFSIAAMTRFFVSNPPEVEK